MALSPAVSAIVHETAQLLGYDDPTAPEALEGVAAYYVLQHVGLDAGDAAAALERLHTGGAYDARLDAIAIIVNDRIITPDHDLSVIEDELIANRAVHATFILVQATGADPARRGSLSVSDKIAGFVQGVHTFLHSSATARGINDTVRGWLVLRDKLMALFKKYDVTNNCSVKANLVWPIRMELQDVHKNDIQIFKDSVAAAQSVLLASPPSFEFINEESFLQIANDANRRMSCKISADWLSKGPSVSDLALSFAGYVPADAFVRLISFERAGKREIIHHMFQDNVRAYLGEEGGVNLAIKETLESTQERNQFHLRNNGVTMIARRSAQDDEKYVFEDVQIVNGCQTSYTLLNTMKSRPSEDWSGVWVPLRLVVSDDQALIDEIILGVNQQEAVSAIQVLSRREYVIGLAQHIAANVRKKPKVRIWFERRTGEHDRNEHGNRVVSLQDLMHAYSAMFSAAPHSDLTPSSLRQAVKRHRLLNERHDKDFYYLAAILLFWAREGVQAQNLFSRKRDWQEYGAKSQLLHALRLLVDKKAKVKLPAERSGKSAEAYLARVRSVILDEPTMQSLGKKAVAVVDNAETSVKGKDGNKLQGTLSALARLEPFTRRVEQLCERTSV